MLKAISSATLYNEYKNPSTGEKVWRKTILKAVHWENNRAANVIASGLESADSTFVMIWMGGEQGKAYLPPKQYAALPPGEVGGHWTLWEMHDRMVKGTLSTEEVLETLAPLESFDDMITVKKVDTLDYGPASAHHWEVTGT